MTTNLTYLDFIPRYKFQLLHFPFWLGFHRHQLGALGLSLLHLPRQHPLPAFKTPRYLALATPQHPPFTPFPLHPLPSPVYFSTPRLPSLPRYALASGLLTQHSSRE